MMPLLILVGFLEGLLPRPWNLIGAGLAAAFWTLALVLQDRLAVGDRDAVAGVIALGFVNAFVGMLVAVRLRGIVARAMRAP
jgi:hypothetical protein